MGGDVRWQCHFNENINIMITQVEKWRMCSDGGGHELGANWH